MTLTEKQQKGLEIAIQRYKKGEKYTCIAGYAGSGKAQPVDTLIPTPTGMKKLEDVQVGDYVFDRRGKPTKILGVFPQGKKKCYKVGFANKQYSLCAGEHLWSCYDKQGNLFSITTEEMMKAGLKNHQGYKYKIPQNQPVQYSHKEYLVDPYMMGVFLGDGCCKQRYLTLSSENEEIPELIGQIIGATPEKNNGKNYNWTFRWNNYKKEISWVGANGVHRKALREKPQTKDYFSKYFDYLITYSYNKDIPEEYKYGDIGQRISLVQGLLDTNGTIGNKDNHRYNIRYTSSSIKLIKSLQEVLNSLGYLSTISEDKRSNKYTNGCCYNLSINICNEEKYKLFRLKRKKEIALEAQKYHKAKDYSKRAITSIEPLDIQQEMVCIFVDNDEHLYLTNDYIVTHNTTLINFIISTLKVPEDQVAYCAFTGKAAQVLRNKGCPNAVTAHRLLYYARQNKYGKYTFSPRKHFENPSLRIIVCDEISMLPKTMWDLLLSHPGIYVIACGDPFQIPCINPEEDNHILDEPHIFLDEIMRQALDSEIIRTSMWIREKKPLISYPCEQKETMIVEGYSNPMLLWADQILCATNETREEINRQVRALKGLDGDPKVGDKIIGLHNQWSFLSEKENALTNGCIGTITKCRKGYMYVPSYISRRTIPILYTDIETEDGDKFYDVPIDYTYITTGKKFLTPQQEYKMKKNKELPDPPFDFTYGYAITCHKAQGSEWNKILVFEEWFPNEKTEHARWLYTAITRASRRCVIVRR